MSAPESNPPPGSDRSGSSGRQPSLLKRFRRFWGRHRTLFWILHSGWALATGVVVILLARERYGFVPWVVLFLVLTWASTLYFGRAAPDEDGGSGDASEGPELRTEVTSYLTRTMYQETLFFLLPFYAYSTVIGSLNVAFPLLLGGLAFFSCLDLVFDRWLRRGVLFPLLFFATVTFAALNLLLPLFFSLDPGVSTPLAALLAVGSAVPLLLRGPKLDRGSSLRLGVAAILLLAVAVQFSDLVPPVPLRMESVTFASDIDRESLELADSLGPEVDADVVSGGIVVLVRVFAPSAVPTTVSLRWERDGSVVRTTREVEIVAHGDGFRLWDRWRPTDRSVSPGRYRIELRTGGSRVFGVAELVVHPSGRDVRSPGGTGTRITARADRPGSPIHRPARPAP